MPHLKVAEVQVLWSKGWVKVLSTPINLFSILPFSQKSQISSPYPVSFPSPGDLHPTFEVLVFAFVCPFPLLNSHHDQL